MFIERLVPGQEGGAAAGPVELSLAVELWREQAEEGQARGHDVRRQRQVGVS